MDCLDENVVIDFVRGQLPPATAREVGAHLDTCIACRMLVASAAKSSVAAWSSSRYKTSQPSQDGQSPKEGFSSGHFPDDRVTERSLSDLNTGPYVRSPELVSPGQLLDGRFRLRRMLGRGAMGQIYAAYDERLKVQVALKLLLPEFASSRAYLERLHQEIVVARRISHPNVCRVYDLGKSNGIHFISMEVVEGHTLEERLEREKVSTRAALDILHQIISALEAAHRGGVIHRDLKPANIMINARGHVTVMDFGLARDLNRESTERQGPGGSVVGTPAYWSPEQGRGERATPASDLYSVGVIACRMFTGARPHKSEDPLLLVPSPYRDVVARCLEPDPNKRFLSAEALHYALLAAERRARPAWVYALRAFVPLAIAAIVVIGLRVPLSGRTASAPSNTSPASLGDTPKLAVATPSPLPPSAPSEHALAGLPPAVSAAQPSSSASVSSAWVPVATASVVPPPPSAFPSSLPTAPPRHPKRTLAPRDEHEVLQKNPQHDPPARVPVFE